MSDEPAAGGGTSAETPDGSEDEVNGAAEKRPGVRGRLAPNLLRPEAWALFVATLLIAVFFSLWNRTDDVFFSAANFRTIAANQSVLGIAVIAALLPLICNHFDLSVGANVTLTAVTAAKMFEYGVQTPIVVVLAVITGAVVGFSNGFLTTFLRVNAVVITLGTATVLTGLLAYITGGTTLIKGIPAGVVDFGSERVIGIPLSFIVLIALSVLAWYILEHTPLGRALYAYGSNESAAQLIGLSVKRLTWISMTLGGAFAGAGGMLALARAGAASPRFGGNLLLAAFAAAFLSAAAIKPGMFNVFGSTVAIFFLAVISSGLNIAGVESYVSNFVNGTALIIGVAATSLFARRRGAVDLFSAPPVKPNQ